MLKFAICGNIASGKSVVQKFLSGNGFKVVDTDDISHKLLTVKNIKLFNAFKTYDVFENGEFSRKKLGQLVFTDDSLRRKLEMILHPQIRAELESFFLLNCKEKAVFVGIPLLFEANMQDMFDKIIFVYAEEHIRLKRLMERNNFSLPEAKARVSAQMSQDEKVKLSDYVINNNGSICKLEEQVINLCNGLELT